MTHPVSGHSNWLRTTRYCSSVAILSPAKLLICYSALDRKSKTKFVAGRSELVLGYLVVPVDSSKNCRLLSMQLRMLIYSLVAMRHSARSFQHSIIRHPKRTPKACFAELRNGQDYVAGLVYDFETSSGDASTTEPVQLAVVCTNSRHEDPPTFIRYVLPSGEIEPGAEAVHGITKEFLVSQGARPFADVYAEMRSWLDTNFGPERPLVWTAHNGERFDEPILRRLAASSGGGTLPDHWRFHDTLPHARGVVEKGERKWVRGAFTLSRLYSDATGGSSLDGAHDAFVDCSALATVWKWLVEQQRQQQQLELPNSQSEVIAAMSARSFFQTHLQEVGYAPPGSKVDFKRVTSTVGVSRRSTSATTAAAHMSIALHAPLSGLPGVGPTVEAKLEAAQGWTQVEHVVGHLKVEHGNDANAFKSFVFSELTSVRNGHPPPLQLVAARTAAKRIAEYCANEVLVNEGKPASVPQP